MAQHPDEPDLVVDRRGHVIVATLNRPDKGNALSDQMLEALAALWVEADTDESVRACVITGAGGTFCTGADLDALTGGITENHFDDVDYARWPAMLKGWRPRTPIIAAVEGPTIGGGVELLLGTDIRVAGASATFALAEARWGMYPMAGAAVRLPRQIPYTIAAEMILTGRRVNAAKAAAHGLVGHVVPEGRALDHALSIADSIVSTRHNSDTEAGTTDL